MQMERKRWILIEREKYEVSLMRYICIEYIKQEELLELIEWYAL